MEALMEILEDICPDIDFETEDTLVDDNLISSFDILSIISEISEEYDIVLSPADITPANFNSAERMWAMIQRLMA